MRFAAFTITTLVVFTGFATAVPVKSAETGISVREKSQFENSFTVFARRCKKRGANCRHNKQCCSHVCKGICGGG